MSSSHSSRFGYVMVLALMVWSGIAPADQTVWMVESVWSVGLLAVLAVTRKWFKFSTAAFFAVMTTVAMAGVWEIVEWLYAAIDGGEAGAAFLGS